MTIATSSLLRPAGEEAVYEPGVCNIGPQEVAQRRRIGHLGVAVTVGCLGLLLAFDAPPIWRLALALPATVAASGYLQAWLRFCVAFGFRGVFNLGPLGQADGVTDSLARARDRRRAVRLGLVSLALGLLTGATAWLLPV